MPLKGLRLEELDLEDTRTVDIAPLRGMKLKSSLSDQTRVADVSPLAGMPLKFFSATTIPAIDYSALAGAPGEVLYPGIAAARPFLSQGLAGKGFGALRL